MRAPRPPYPSPPPPPGPTRSRARAGVNAFFNFFVILAHPSFQRGGEVAAGQDPYARRTGEGPAAAGGGGVEAQVLAYVRAHPEVAAQAAFSVAAVAAEPDNRRFAAHAMVAAAPAAAAFGGGGVAAAAPAVATGAHLNPFRAAVQATAAPAAADEPALVKVAPPAGGGGGGFAGVGNSWRGASGGDANPFA
jgi:hypothetical protein